MAEITQQQINEAIKTCKWRQVFAGVDICSGNVGPCSKEIEAGRCVTLIELFQNEKKEDTQ